METTVGLEPNNLKKLWTTLMIAFLVSAFVIVQPITTDAVEAEDVFEDLSCDPERFSSQGTTMDTVLGLKNKVAKTTHSEKQVFLCFLKQGGLPVFVEVTIIAEIYENMTSKSIIRKQAEVITCIRSAATFDIPGPAQVIACRSDSDIPSDIVPTGTDCVSTGVLRNQDSVSKGATVKTIEAQKFIYLCDFDNDIQNGFFKKVDDVIFTEIWEDLKLLPNDPVVKKTFEEFRCVINLFTAEVESCRFSTVPS